MSLTVARSMLVMATGIGLCQAADYEGRFTSEVAIRDVTPFGLNLGSWTSWGAEQLLSNVIKNPGFEGVIDRAMVLIHRSAPGAFDDSTDWLARPDGFWIGARLSVRSGRAAGRGGSVLASRAVDAHGLPSFQVSDSGLQLDAGDAVALTKWNDADLPCQWWFSKDPGAGFSADLQHRRPGSPGIRALRVVSQAGTGAEVTSYLDAIGDRAGKLLPFEGAWALSFWTRLDRGAATLHVSLGRDGALPLFQHDVDLSTAWRKVDLQFPAKDAGSHGIASLRFRVTGAPSGEVLLDDVDLHRVSDAGFPFRSEVVSALAKMHPAYLRNWEGQLGETWENYSADPFARRSTRYRPGDTTQTDFGYGLPEFLELCLRTHTAPWIVVPTTFSDQECAEMGAYLANDARYRQFPEILAEFGNENWNELFRPAGIPDARAHGQVADRCFALLKQKTGSLNLKAVVNAQHGNPAGALDFAKRSHAGDIVAIAPYLLHSLDVNRSINANKALLFAGDQGNLATIAGGVQALGKDLAVYEVNLHTIDGAATADERKPIVAGLPSGSALAKVMLDGLAAGARRQCVYTLAGYDTRLSTGHGYAPLWGVVRDLGPTPRLRPTGLALSLLNRALDGDLHRVNWQGAADVSVYGFHAQTGWSVALVSSSAADRSVRLQFPASDTIPDHMLLLAEDRPGATNEDGEHVTIQRGRLKQEGNRVSLVLPAWSLAVLLPEGAVE